MISSCTFASVRWPSTRAGEFFFTSFLSLCLDWFVCWLLTITGWRRWHGTRRVSWPAAAMTRRWRSGRWARKALLSASRRWHSSRYVFFPSFFSLKFSPLCFCWFVSWLLTIFSVNSVVWSPDGKQIASGSYDKTIKIWDSQSRDCQSTLRGHRHT